LISSAPLRTSSCIKARSFWLVSLNVMLRLLAARPLQDGSVPNGVYEKGAIREFTSVSQTVSRSGEPRTPAELECVEVMFEQDG
jgi:hypothetical protein